jgi:hypothetical protein
VWCAPLALYPARIYAFVALRSLMYSSMKAICFGSSPFGTGKGVADLAFQRLASTSPIALAAA